MHPLSRVNLDCHVPMCFIFVLLPSARLGFGWLNMWVVLGWAVLCATARNQHCRNPKAPHPEILNRKP